MRIVFGCSSEIGAKETYFSLASQKRCFREDATDFARHSELEPLSWSIHLQQDLYKTGANLAPGARALVQNLGADVGAELHLCIMWMRVAVSFNVLATPAPAAAFRAPGCDALRHPSNDACSCTLGSPVNGLRRSAPLQGHKQRVCVAVCTSFSPPCNTHQLMQHVHR